MHYVHRNLTGSSYEDFVLKQEIQQPNLIIIHYNGYYNIKQLHVFKTTENTAK